MAFLLHFFQDSGPTGEIVFFLFVNLPLNQKLLIMANYNTKSSNNILSSTPHFEEVKSFFIQQSVPVSEAEVFYFYYQSTGWHKENGMPLGNWKDAAHDWLYNLEN